MLRKAILWGCTFVLAVLVLGLATSVLEIRTKIRIPGDVQTRFRFLKTATVELRENFSTEATLDGRLDIPVKGPFSIPLDFELAFPVDAKLRIDQDFTINTEVPVQFTFAPGKADLNEVWVDLDTDVFVDDKFEVDLLLPVTSPVQAFGFLNVPVAGRIPVKAIVPIRQPIHIKDRVKVGLSNLELKVNAVIPLRANIPIHQEVHVKGEVMGRVHKTITVPFSERLNIPLHAKMPVGLHFDSPIKVGLDDFVPITIQFDEALPVRLESVGVDSAHAN